MSDASHTTKLPSAAEENTSPLPIPPHEAATDVTTGPILVQVLPICFVRIRDEDFSHPDEPTLSELNDSDQENTPPPTREIQSPHPLFQGHARVLHHGRDVHPTWVKPITETLSNKGLEF